MAVDAQELFNVRVPRGLVAQPERAREFPLILQFNVSGPRGGTWTVDTIHEPASCTPGQRSDVQCTIEISDEAIEELLQAEAIARPQVVMKHILEGTIEVEGDVTQAMKLSRVFSVADAAGEAP